MRRPGTRRRERLRRHALDADLPELAATLARSVRSGAPLAVALREAAEVGAGPSARELDRVLVDVDRGVDLDTALASWSARAGSSSVELLVAAARVGHAHGGDLPAALEGAAASLVDRNELRDEARALASQSRASAGVLLCLPPLGAAAFSLMDPAVAATLFTTPIGWVCLASGLCLELAGASVLSRMVRSASSLTGSTR